VAADELQPGFARGCRQRLEALDQSLVGGQRVRRLGLRAALVPRLPDRRERVSARRLGAGQASVQEQREDLGARPEVAEHLRD
jgi:hypothetical protein